MSVQFLAATIEEAKRLAAMARADGNKVRIGYLVKRESFAVYLTPKPEKPRYREVAMTCWGKRIRDRTFSTHEELLAFEAHLRRWGTSIAHWRVYETDADGEWFWTRDGHPANTPGWQPTPNWTGD